jgi:hypothetical protein
MARGLGHVYKSQILIWLPHKAGHRKKKTALLLGGPHGDVFVVVL